MATCLWPKAKHRKCDRQDACKERSKGGKEGREASEGQQKRWSKANKRQQHRQGDRPGAHKVRRQGGREGEETERAADQTPAGEWRKKKADSKKQHWSNSNKRLEHKTRRSKQEEEEEEARERAQRA